MAEQIALLPISGGEDPERLADVIFVHGLDGDARSTWHPKDQPKHFWPAWLGEEMTQLGVWSLNYAVSASAWKGHSMPLVDRANNVLDLFALEDIGQRPLALICHSLGGLLMKQVLRTPGMRGTRNGKQLSSIPSSWYFCRRHTRGPIWREST